VKIPNFFVSTVKHVTFIEDGKVTWENKDRLRGVIWGITWDENYLYLLNQNTKIRPEILVKFNKRNLEEFEKLYLQRDLCQFNNFPEHETRGSHQIFYDIKNGLHIMNTGKNIITTLVDENKDTKEYEGVILKHFQYPDDNKRHINTMWSSNGIDYYVIEHNGNDPPSALSGLKMQNGQFRHVQRWKNIGIQCHNIHISKHEDEGWLRFVTLSSEERSIKQFAIRDELSNDAEKRLERRKYINALGHDRWFVRGLGRVLGFWFVGLSEFHKSGPDRHYSKKTGVAVLDDDWNLIQEIDLSGKGQIYDLRVTEGLDECHNGIPW